MLPLESQICSLTYSKQLKELGVKQTSYFHLLENNIIKVEDANNAMD